MRSAHEIKKRVHSWEKAAHMLTAERKHQMARVTGLEPAASAVTGRRSNQLSYTRAFEVLVLYLLTRPPVNVLFERNGKNRSAQEKRPPNDSIYNDAKSIDFLLQ